MMLKPACNGKPRRKSSTMLQEWPPAPPPFNGLPVAAQLRDHATLERLTRLTSGLHSGTHKELVRATVKVPMAEEQRREQDRVFQ